VTGTGFATEVLRWAKTYGWRSFHVRNSGFAGQSYVQGDKGFVDLLMVRGNRLVVAELKIGKAGTKRGEPRRDQMEWMQALADVGAEVHTWRPTDWSSILAILSQSDEARAALKAM